MVVGKNTLKIYGYKDMNDYFNYIVDSQINGNFSQVKELFKKLTNEQKNEFFKFLKDNEIKFNYTGLF